MSWLRDTFPELGNDSTEVERIRYARAYILKIIGGYLMPDLSRNLVHLRWLLKLIDFRADGKFCWGSVVLATLYQEMCGATPPTKTKIGGWNAWPGAYLFPMTPTQPTIYRPPSQEGLHEAPSGSSSHYQS
ncbi:hypothetical protein Goklo_008413, partial [Gossypium klotzschianum]|nr:hypothetical protein [Gossypium klotzschianum]